MCGISVVLALSAPSAQHNDLDTLQAMIGHRGPDGTGVYREPRIGLGHRRLAIIDTSHAADQPFHWNHAYVLVFNGEIYNYLELREELISLGFHFRTNSDTEVLIAAYEHWGPSCQNRFNGMWAFAIWDRQRGHLFCSRDRFGVKPLFWAQSKGQLFLASEIKQLRAVGIGAKVNSSELSAFLYTGITNSSAQTFFSDIYSIPPGHSLSVTPGGAAPVIERWYDLQSAVSQHPTVHASAISSLLRDSVRLRMRSDVTVGSCLSGGLDSSSIVMLAAEARHYDGVHPPTCIHARATDGEVDEHTYARLVADVASCRMITVVPTPDQFWSQLDAVCLAQEEPFGSPSIFMQYFVMQAAKADGCKVMLDGQGADEVLLGYSKYTVLALADAWRRRGLCGLTRALLNSWQVNPDLNPISSLKYLVGTSLGSLRIAHTKKRLPFLRLSTESSNQLLRAISAVSFDTQRTHLLELFRTSLPALLRYEDRNSMAHSVEARLPFLDYRLVEACLSLVTSEKIHQGWSKYPLRTSSILPHEIAWRRSKLGFNAPERSWIGPRSSLMLQRILQSPIMAEIADLTGLQLAWQGLDRRDQWRLFNTAIWAEVMGLESL